MGPKTAPNPASSKLPLRPETRLESGDMPASAEKENGMQTTQGLVAGLMNHGAHEYLGRNLGESLMHTDDEKCQYNQRHLNQKKQQDKLGPKKHHIVANPHATRTTTNTTSRAPADTTSQLLSHCGPDAPLSWCR